MKPRIRIAQNPFTGEPVGRLAEPRAPRERVQALPLLERFGGRIDSAATIPDEDDERDG